MKFGIFSDTHNRLGGIDAAFTVFVAESVDLVIHCGDWTTPSTVSYVAKKSQMNGLPLAGVLGNNDLEINEMLNAANKAKDFVVTEGIHELQIGPTSIAIYHGHHGPTLRGLLSGEHDLLLLGHSHKPRYDRIITDEGTRIILNPGSTAFAIPRQKNWHGSVAIYDCEKRQAEFYYLPLL